MMIMLYCRERYHRGTVLNDPFKEWVNYASIRFAGNPMCVTLVTRLTAEDKGLPPLPTISSHGS